MITLNKITERITSVVLELRDNAGYAGERGDIAARLESELAMFVTGFKACQDAVIFETNHVVEPETEIEVPKQWEKYFEKEQKEYQEYLRLKAKFENLTDLIVPEDYYDEDLKDFEIASLVDFIDDEDDEPKQETLEDAAERHDSDRDSFIAGAKYMVERMYTEEEVRAMIEKALTHNDYNLCGSLVTAQGEIRTANFGVWFEEYKKK
jgi:hypothetical protein